MFEVKMVMNGEHVYEATCAGHSVVMDTGSEEKQGQSPMELLLSAIAGCASVDVVTILKKRRKTVDHFEVDVQAKRRDEPFPRIFTHIEVTFKVTSPDVNQLELDKAIETSLETYCSVRGMIRPDVVITTKGLILR